MNVIRRYLDQLFWKKASLKERLIITAHQKGVRS